MRAQRLKLRLTDDERELNAAAARAVDETMSDFFRRAARARAQEILGDPREIPLNTDDAVRLLSALEQPAPEAGVHCGRDTFETFLRAWLESFDDFRIEPEQILEDEDRLIALVHQSGTGRASGIEVEARIAQVWTVKDGRVVRWQSYSSREEALAGSAQS